MKRSIIAAMLLASLVGCEVGKQDFQNEWYSARAKVLFGVAREQFQAGQLEEAHSKCRESITLDKTFVPAQLLLAKVYIEKGHYGGAVRLLEKLAERNPDSSELFFLLGCAQEKHDQAEKAVASFRKAYSLGDKSDMSPIMAATEALTSMGRLRQAQLYVESYLGEAGNEAGMFELAGRLAIMQDQFDRAARYYEQAQDLDYDNIRYGEAVGRAQFFSSRYADTKDTFKILTKRDDYDAPAWVWTMLGDSSLALGHLADARNAYQKACELQPDNPGGWLNQAKVALALRDEVRAILSAQRSLQLNPHQQAAAMVLGYALIRNDQAEKAVWLLDKYTKMHPGEANFHSLRGKAYAEIGRTDIAVECYQQALNVEPGNVLAKELLSAESGQTLSKLN